MILWFWIIIICGLVRKQHQLGLVADLPTNYEYFTDGGIKQGLNASQSYFTLNDKLVRIYSGAMHYFRVPRPYWRDRLRKIRAAGLNTVETYVPWNLHEPESGKYDFGAGGSEFEDFLHLEQFLSIAKEEDLFVILRTGPYICSEYNFGGFPSWLLGEKPMGFRTSEPNYMKFVTRYFNVLLTLLAAFQFTRGGPVIAFQVENEYGNLEYGDKFQPDKVYLEQLRQLFLKNDIVELLVTADSPLWHGTKGTLPGVLFQTANFGDDATGQLNKLLEFQPGRPQMVMEYWIGWYDVVGGQHSIKSDEDSKRVLKEILDRNASFNAYMFHGGTNFGFNNGANLNNDLLDNSGYDPITTSYDYDAPISESGAYRKKYYIVKDLVAEANPVQTFIPEVPEYDPPVAYPKTNISEIIALRSILDNKASLVVESKNLVPMEFLDINDGNGQDHGYIVYRKENVDLDESSVLKIDGHVCDTVLVLVNGVLVAPQKLESVSDLDGFGYWRLENSSTIINNVAFTGATVDLVLENMGRVHGAGVFQYNQTLKGLWQGDVSINEKVLSNWKIYPLELKRQWINNLTGWTYYSRSSSSGPAFYKSILKLEGAPKDSFIDTRGWGKGMVFVNGNALGRYAAIGPEFTLYLPAPFLQEGDNEIVFFEHFAPPADGAVNYVDDQIFVNPTSRIYG